MRAKLRTFGRKFPDEVARALYIETEIELKEVKRRTPVDTGELRASEHVVGPIRRFRQIYTEIVAGGPAAPYAIYVHEDPDAFHKVGEWKFIESVLLESRPFMAERIAKRIDLNRAA
jgi:hypothetical protein